MESSSSASSSSVLGASHTTDLAERFSRRIRGLVQEHSATLGIQLSGFFMLLLYGLPVAYGLFWVCDKLVGVRASAEDEHAGLDLAEHGLEAYGKDQ